MAERERIGSVAHIKHSIGCLHAVGQIPWQKQRFPVCTRLVRYEASYGHGAQLDQLARCRPGNGGIVDDVALFGNLGVPDEADRSFGEPLLDIALQIVGVFGLERSGIEILLAGHRRPEDLPA